MGCVEDFKAAAGQAVIDKLGSVMGEATDVSGLASRLGVSSAQVSAAKDVVNNGMASLKGLINIPSGDLEIPSVAGALQDQLKAVEMQVDLSVVNTALADYLILNPGCATDPALATLSTMETRMGATVQDVADIDASALTAAKAAADAARDEIDSQLTDAADIEAAFGL